MMQSTAFEQQAHNLLMVFELMTYVIKKEMPDFRIDYKTDFTPAIADSWPASIDDSVAKKDWGLSYDFDISEMTKDMLKNLKIKLNAN